MCLLGSLCSTASDPQRGRSTGGRAGKHRVHMRVHLCLTTQCVAPCSPQNKINKRRHGKHGAVPYGQTYSGRCYTGVLRVGAEPPPPVSAGPPNPHQREQRGTANVGASGARNFFLSAFVDRGTAPPPQFPPFSPTFPHFVVHDKRGFYAPSLCIFQMLRMQQKIQKCRETPEKALTPPPFPPFFPSDALPHAAGVGVRT